MKNLEKLFCSALNVTKTGKNSVAFTLPVSALIHDKTNKKYFYIYQETEKFVKCIMKLQFYCNVVKIFCG